MEFLDDAISLLQTQRFPVATGCRCAFLNFNFILFVERLSGAESYEIVLASLNLAVVDKAGLHLETLALLCCWGYRQVSLRLTHLGIVTGEQRSIKLDMLQGKVCVGGGGQQDMISQVNPLLLINYTCL